MIFKEEVDYQVQPPRSGVKFRDLFQGLCSRKVNLCDYELYQHQLEAVRHLVSGRNLVLNAETGGGKTEVWAAYALERQLSGDFNVLVVYPTKALAGDQMVRISRYYNQAGFRVDRRVMGRKRRVEVFTGDAVKYDGDVSQYLRDVSGVKTVLTNPEVVKNALESGRHRISPFLRRLKMVVLDEFDFYRSSKATLLLHVIRRLAEKYGTRPQVVLMSATLTNPEAIRSFLDAEVVGGRAHRPTNVTYFVLGPEATLRDLHRSLNSGVDFEEFVRDFFKYASDPKYRSAFEAALRGNRDAAAALLERYLQCEELTLVFTRTTSEANNLVGKLGGKVDYDGGPAAVHHSGVDKEKRQAVEEGMREGKVKLVVSVRTLLQGIDVGGTKRVVHLGLPHTVRELVQREGRKGRRVDLGVTESLMIPLSAQDAVLLSDYLNSLRRWVSMGSESLILTPENELLKLYDVILGVEEDQEFLRRVGIDPHDLPKISFYEQFASRTPRHLWDGGTCVQLDDVSRRDLVEKFQVGAIDAFNGSVVVRNWRHGGAGRWVILESTSLRPFKCAEVEARPSRALLEAEEKYEGLNAQWGQKPDMEGDIRRGKLWSSVALDLLFSGKGGFKRAREIARWVRWYLESRVKFPVAVEEEGSIPSYHVERIDLNYTPPPWLSYDLTTYVYVTELDPADADRVDEGMNFLIALLRLNYGVDLDTLNYGKSQGGLLKVWETEPVGLLRHLREGKPVLVKGTRLDCTKLLHDVRNTPVTDQLRLLLEYLDPYTFHGRDPKKSREVAERFVHYLCDSVPARLRALGEVLIPRKPPEGITVVDSFLSRYAVVTRLGVEVFDDLTSASKEALKASVDQEGPVVTYGLKLNVDKRFSHLVLDLHQEVNEVLGGPLSLAKARELILGDGSLLEEENELAAKASRREELGEVEVRGVFEKRAETVGLLFNLVEVLKRREGREERAEGRGIPK